MKARGYWKLYEVDEDIAQSVTSSPQMYPLLWALMLLDPEARPPLLENTLEEGVCSYSAAQIKALYVLKTDSLTLSSKRSVK